MRRTSTSICAVFRVKNQIIGCAPLYRHHRATSSAPVLISALFSYPDKRSIGHAGTPGLETGLNAGIETWNYTVSHEEIYGLTEGGTTSRTSRLQKYSYLPAGSIVQRSRPDRFQPFHDQVAPRQNGIDLKRREVLRRRFPQRLLVERLHPLDDRAIRVRHVDRFFQVVVVAERPGVIDRPEAPVVGDDQVPGFLSTLAMSSSRRGPSASADSRRGYSEALFSFQSRLLVHHHVVQPPGEGRVLVVPAALDRRRTMFMPIRRSTLYPATLNDQLSRKSNSVVPPEPVNVLLVLVDVLDVGVMRQRAISQRRTK